jgi:hypothetical protein
VKELDDGAGTGRAVFNLNNVNGSNYDSAFQSDITSTQSPAWPGTSAFPTRYVSRGASLQVLGLAMGDQVGLYTGAGDPEGALSATTGSLYLRAGGSAGSQLYIKESGAGNTGWAAK